MNAVTDQHRPADDYDAEMVARLRPMYRSVATTTTVTPRALEVGPRRPHLAVRLATVGLVAATVAGVAVLATSTRRSEPAVATGGSLDGWHAVPRSLPSGMGYVGTAEVADSDGNTVQALVYEGGRTRMTIVPRAALPWQDTEVQVETLDRSGADIEVTPSDVVDSFLPVSGEAFAKLTLRRGFVSAEWLPELIPPIRLGDTPATIRLTGGLRSGLSICLGGGDRRSVITTDCWSGPEPSSDAHTYADGKVAIAVFDPSVSRIEVDGVAVKTTTQRALDGSSFLVADVRIDTSTSHVVVGRSAEGSEITRFSTDTRQEQQ